MEETLLSPSMVPTASLPFYVQGQTFFLLALALLLLSFAPHLPPSVLLTIVILLLTTLLTRILTGRNTHSALSADADGSRTVPRVPYWIPFFGHIPSMAYDSASFLRGLRATYTRGVFGLKLLGKTHHVVYGRDLVTAILDAESLDGEEIMRRMLVNVCGFPTREMGKYDAARPELQACEVAHYPSEGDLRGVGVAMGGLQWHLHEFVTGNESMVDQMQWERASRVEIVKDSKGKDVVEASLLPLVRDFSAHVATPTLIGTDFLENYPTFFDELWLLNQGFWTLAAGLPRWAPIPSLTRAHIAQRNLIGMLSAFHLAMEKEANGEDPGPDWQFLEPIRGLVKARMLVYRKHEFNIAARAAMELSLLRDYTNTNTLIFWMVNRIYADKVLLELIREEISPHVHAVQPRKEFEFVNEPPSFDKWDIESLLANCPLLKSCYIECLRLDTASWSSRVAKQDFVLRANAKDAPAWSVRKGEYVHAAHDLHDTNPEYFKDPLVWKADRHIKVLGEGGANFELAIADIEPVQPHGRGPSVCESQMLAFSQCVAYTAGLVALWDIEMAGGGAWKLPHHSQATGVYSTKDDTRVWVRRRKLAQADEE